MSHRGEEAEVGRGRNAAARLVDGMGRRGPSQASVRCEDTKSFFFFFFVGTVLLAGCTSGCAAAASSSGRICSCKAQRVAKLKKKKERKKLRDIKRGRIYNVFSSTV